MILDPDILATTLHHALASGGDFSEVFVEDCRTSTARYDDAKIEELVSGRERGAGIRVIRGDTTGFAHTADLTARGLRAAAQAAASAAGAGGGGVRVVPFAEARVDAPHEVRFLPGQVDKASKVEVLARADAAAREEGREITSVTAGYSDAHRRIQVANSLGLLTRDEQVRTRLTVHCVATGDSGMQTATEAPGRSVGFEMFDEIDPEETARTAARRALTLLRAVPAPTGKLAVVLRRGAGGVLFHEACGHGLEADLVGKDASVFRGRVGERVADEKVTLIDDGAYAREWGTIGVDDEGTSARRNVLIEGGVLGDYMWDLVRARKEGRPLSGNGRRQSYRHLPMPRMTNTFVLAGDEDPDEIIRATERGIYCVRLGGGEVNTATGDFVFGVTEGYLIERGEITDPIRAAQLIGNGPETLGLVDAVGSDFETWTGICGKNGQGVPVSSGQPTLRVREMTVGGTAGA